jgi:hypothetical protein
MTTDNHPKGLREWDGAWSYVATLPAPLSHLVHDALSEMIKVLVEAADERGDVATFDLLLFVKGVERYLRTVMANPPPDLDAQYLSKPNSSSEW